MAKVNHYFKHFPNSISIFDLVKRRFSFEQHASDFNSRLAKSNIKETLVNSELERIKRDYQNGSGLSRTWYDHKRAEQDHPVSSLAVDFILFSDDELIKKSITLPFRIKGEHVTDEKINELLENEFFNSIARGVNDAQLEDLLRKLKRRLSEDSIKKTHKYKGDETSNR